MSEMAEFCTARVPDREGAVTSVYRVLVTGSRDWPGSKAINAALDDILRTAERPMIVVHGGAAGADAFAATWARANALINWPVVSDEEHRGDWKRHGRAAGMIRNQEMVALGADVCLAFIVPCTQCAGKPPHGSHGASHCADLAEKAGIPVRRFGP